MPISARVCVSAGILALLALITNQLTAVQVDPALQRSSVLGSLLAVGLMLIGALWTRVVPRPPERADLQGQEGLLIQQDLPAALQAELRWGSRQLLRATPAAVVLLWRRDGMVLQRGLLSQSQQKPAFEPGPICRQALDKQRTIHLVDLRNYPGRDEFKGLQDNLPSVVVQPIGADALLLLGGWSPRCFSISDLSWIEGWSERLKDEWLATSANSVDGQPVDASGTEPDPPELGS